MTTEIKKGQDEMKKFLHIQTCDFIVSDKLYSFWKEPALTRTEMVEEDNSLKTDKNFTTNLATIFFYFYIHWYNNRMYFQLKDSKLQIDTELFLKAC